MHNCTASLDDRWGIWYPSVKYSYIKGRSNIVDFWSFLCLIQLISHVNIWKFQRVRGVEIVLLCAQIFACIHLLSPYNTQKSSNFFLSREFSKLRFSFLYLTAWRGATCKNDIILKRISFLDFTLYEKRIPARRAMWLPHFLFSK